MLDNVNVFDTDRYFKIPVGKFRKIQFKRSTRQSLFKLYKKRLARKLESKREALAAMEFKGSQVSIEKQREKTEKKLLKKTRAIAELEARVRFLETGTETNYEAIANRALKLKDFMMRNLVYNRNSMYQVNKEAAEKIVSGSTNIGEKINQEQAKANAQVQSILNGGKEGKAVATTKPVEPEKPLDRKTILDAINSQFNGFNRQTVANAVGEKMRGTGTKQPLDKDTVNAAIKNEFGKVSNNGSSAAKINKFVNDDGTYRMKKEDMDEEFRITKIQRNETPVSTSKVGDESKHQKIELKRPYIFNPIVTATRNIENQRHVPENVPPEDAHKMRNDQSSQQTTDTSTPESLMDRIRILKHQRDYLNSQVSEERDRLEQAKVTYEQTIERLRQYADGLERGCNDTYGQLHNLTESANAKQSVINEMLSVLGENTASASDGKGQGRTRK